MAHSRRLRKHLQQGAEELKEEERASPLCSLFLELSVGTQRREHQLPGHGRVAGLEQASELVLRLPHWAGQKFQGLQTWVRLILPMEGPQLNEVRRDRPRPGEKTLSLGRGTVPLRVQSSAPPPPISQAQKTQAGRVCSQQHQPTSANNPNVHRLVRGQTERGSSIQWKMIQP